MGKQYVFWRTPEGRAAKADDDKHAPVQLLTHIGVSATVSNEGTVSWPGFLISIDELGIYSSIIIIGPDGAELNDTDTKMITSSAIVESLKAGGSSKAVLSKVFLDIANKHAATFYRTTPQQYTLVSTLSIKDYPSRGLQIGGHWISPLKARGKKYPYPKHLHPTFDHTITLDYATIKAATHGRSVAEAAERAIGAIELLRGLWTLFGEWQSLTIVFDSPKHRSLGVIHSGPVHTLHLMNGELACDMYWYETNFAERKKLYTPRRPWSTIESHRRWAVGRLRKLSYRVELEHLIRRYVRALDQINLDASFLQLWSILEKLTDTIGARYDDTVKRATWGMNDRGRNQELLNCLRNSRNQLVHSARSSSEQDQMVYLLKSFIEPHLTRLMLNPFNVNSIADYASYLELPDNEDTLRRSRKKLDAALSYLTPSKRPKQSK